MLLKIITLLRKKRRIAFFYSLFVLTSFILFTYFYLQIKNAKPKDTSTFAENELPVNENGEGSPDTTEGKNPKDRQQSLVTNAPTKEPISAIYDEVVEEAKRLAAGYQYDEAIDMIASMDGYGDHPSFKEMVTEWEREKSGLVEWDVKKTTHIFFHSLIVDTSKAFNGGYKDKGYDDYMATVSEFNQIIEEMYHKGYVLVAPHQLAVYRENKKGRKKMVRQKLMLPRGKKAFVLSIDDVSYYQYMEGDGFASRLIIDGDGKPSNEMDMENQTVETGDFDVVPLLERFIEKHPDFSYQGARGILALTGYDGVLGYRTSKSLHKENKEFRKTHPDYDYKEECKKAKSVADALKEMGWLFANHSFSHNNIGQKATGGKRPLSYKAFRYDIRQWRTEVEPIVGKTDMIAFPHGTYLNEPGRADWMPYANDNKRYRYLKKQGIRYFFGVGGFQPWVQLTDEYFRQDRINIDGMGMRGNTRLYKPFFNPGKIYDQNRPTPLQ